LATITQSAKGDGSVLRDQTSTPTPTSVQSIETRLFIGGEFVRAAEGGLIPVYNPHDNSLLAKVAEATSVDIDRAVDAARKAFPAWKRMAAADRGRLLLKLADAIEADAPYLSELECLDTGRERYPISVRYAPDFRDNLDKLGQVLVATPSGPQVPLGELAKLSFAKRTDDDSMKAARSPVMSISI
jgi:hypothetical protein